MHHTALTAAVGLALITSLPAAAATFNVTKTTDTADGACNADCSLREAVIAANASPGPDTVVLPAGTHTLAIPGTGEDLSATGDLDVSEALTITGAGFGATAIDAAGIDRVLDVLASNTLVISGLNVRGGSAPGANGGGVNASSGALTVVDSVVSLNSAGFGGGVAISSGSLTCTNSYLTSNTAGRGGGALSSSGDMIFTNTVLLSNNAGISGGGISNSSGDITLVESIVSANIASGPGGGIETSTGILVITDSTFVSNEALGASFDGGAIFSSTAAVTISGSTFAGNSAGDDGGAFFSSSGTWTIINSTFSGNDANDQGGALAVQGGTWALTNVTFAGNSGSEGGGIFRSGGTLTLRNTILANAPSGDNCFDQAGSGSYISAGNNLSNDVSCVFALTAPGDLNNVNAMLGPLVSNGGSTQTHALFPGSSAIDSAGGCPPPAADQRGVARPQGRACDIGSFELQGVVQGPAVNVPTLSGPLLALLGLALAVAGYLVLRRA